MESDRLHNASVEDLAKLDDLNYLDSLTKEELEELWDDVSEKHASIKEQLMRAKGKAQQDGVYADVDWLASAERARRHSARQLQKIQKAIGRKRNGSQDISRRLDRLVVAAEAVLEHTSFPDLQKAVDEARGGVE